MGEGDPVSGHELAMTPLQPPGTGLPALDDVLQGLRPGRQRGLAGRGRSRTTSPLVLPFVARARAEGRPRRLLPLRPARAAARRGVGRRDPPHLAGPRLRELHRRHPPGHRGGRAGGLLRLRLPLRPGRRLVQRPDAGQLLHGHLPVPVRARHGGLLRAPLRTTTPPRRSTPSAAPPRSWSTSSAAGGTVYVHPLKVHGRHSPTMYLPHVCEGETLPAPHRERRALRGAGRRGRPARSTRWSSADVWDRRVGGRPGDPRRRARGAGRARRRSGRPSSRCCA